MYKRILPLLLLALSLGAQAQQVKHSDWQSLRLAFDQPTLQVSPTTLFGEHFATLAAEGYLSSNRVGQPDMPVLSSMIEVPLCEGFEIELTLLEADTIEGPKLPIAPCQPSRSKSDRSEPTLVIDPQAYTTDAFTDHPLCQVLPVGVARSVNLAQVVWSPVRYNPVKNQLIVVRHAEVTIRYRQPDIDATQALARHHSPAFSTGAQTLNSLPGSKDIAQAQQAPIHYLIVAHSMFRGQLDDFIAWKRRKGFLVTVGYTDQAAVGTTATSIANYVKSFYTNATAALPAPTFLLIVGDHEQVPAHTGQWDYGSQSVGQQVTDLYYTTWTTGDIIPDCYCGRFSAQNISQLTPQIEKTLMYEQYTFADPTFLSRGILVAGVDNGSPSDNGYKFGDPAMDYAAREYVNAANGFTTVTYYKNNTSFAPTGVTVTGSSQASGTAAALRTLYSQGAGWVNYTAHGSASGWADPSFSSSHVASMTNTQKFGFMIGNCCQTATFNESQCFAEALLRKGNYCGAVEYFGASNYSYWYEDFYWSVGARTSSSISNTMNPAYDASNLGMYDRLFHTHGESRSNQYLTAGAMMMAGNMAVQSSTSSGKQYYWEIYHNFGDPSVMPWLGLAQQMTVSVASAVPMGTPTLTLTAVPYAYCALTDGQGTLLAAAYADAAGSATLNLTAISLPGLYELAVSAQHYRTHFQNINIIVANGPYVVAEHFGATLNAGQPVQFAATLKNVGNAPTSQLRAELVVDRRTILLSGSDSLTLSNLTAGDSLVLSALFSGQMAQTLTDQALTDITLRLRWGNGSDEMSERTYRLPVNAPAICVTQTTLTGAANPGNTVTLTFTDKNQGHLSASGLGCSLSASSAYITLSSGTTSLGTLQPGASATAQYTLTIDSAAPAGYYPMHHIIQSGSVYVDHVYYLPVGRTVEGFESGQFSAVNWLQGSNPWTITGSAQSGTYCARSGAISHSQSSELSLNWIAAVADSISFYYKVSSEQNYDKFHFFLDGQDLLVVSGEENWTRAAFPVSAGNHSFTFTYTKDYSVSNGSDCAWIDQLSLPLSGQVGADSNATSDCAYSVPYFCGFELETERQCWSTTLDLDEDGYTWQPSNGLRTHGGSYCMASASYLNEVGPLTPDNWLLSPRFSLPADGALLSWHAAPQDYNWTAEHYKVLLAPNGGSRPEDFTVTLYETTLQLDSGQWDNPVVTLTDTGEVRLAFVHCNCSDIFWLCLDDISLDTIPLPEPPTMFTLNVLSNDTSMGVATGGGEYEEGTMVTLTAIPFEGFQFTGWSTGDTANPLSFQLYADLTLTAYFTPKSTEGTGVQADCAPQISLFPNPTSGLLYVRSDSAASLEIRDVQGRLVYTATLGDPLSAIDLSALPKGVYFLRSGITVQKIILQ